MYVVIKFKKLEVRSIITNEKDYQLVVKEVVFFLLIVNIEINKKIWYLFTKLAVMTIWIFFIGCQGRIFWHTCFLHELHW